MAKEFYSVFDRENHQKDINSKLVVALERVAELYRVLLWEKAKHVDLSPLQIQLLIFIRFHHKDQNKVTALASEFNMTKATVSDAIKTLIKKDYLQKNQELADKRSFYYTITLKGEQTMDSVIYFANPLSNLLTEMKEEDVQNLYQSLLTFISHAEKKSFINKQRMCLNCRFYENNRGKAYCHLLKEQLDTNDIRIDCPEHSLANP